MDLASDVRRDVFLIHTKGDPVEAELVEAVKDQLNAWGLSSWVYEDWEWEHQPPGGPPWRENGDESQLDQARCAIGHPLPFYHPPPDPEPDPEALAWIFRQSGAILVVTPRTGDPSPGVSAELAVLFENQHPPVFSISWHEGNEDLVHSVGAFFDYRMRSARPHDFGEPAETGARLAWLACTMGRLFECGAMGQHVYRQLARSDAILNRISRHRRPSQIALEPDRLRPAELAGDANAETCAPVLDYWLGGPGYTAHQLTSEKPPAEVVQASTLVRRLLDGWCRLAQERFPALAAESAERLFSLGTAKLRLRDTRAALDDFDRALAAPDAGGQRASILHNRGLAWWVLGRFRKAINDYTTALEDHALPPRSRLASLRMRAIASIDAGKAADAQRDLDEILASDHLDTRSKAPALVNQAFLYARLGKIPEAIDTYERILKLPRPPVQARRLAHQNRAVLFAKRGDHVDAIAECDAALELREIPVRQRTRVLITRAKSKQETDDREGALADYERALTLPHLDAKTRQEIEGAMATLRGRDSADEL